MCGRSWMALASVLILTQFHAAGRPWTRSAANERIGGTRHPAGRRPRKPVVSAVSDPPKAPTCRDQNFSGTRPSCLPPDRSGPIYPSFARSWLGSGDGDSVGWVRGLWSWWTQAQVNAPARAACNHHRRLRRPRRRRPRQTAFIIIRRSYWVTADDLNIQPPAKFGGKGRTFRKKAGRKTGPG